MRATAASTGSCIDEEHTFDLHTAHWMLEIASAVT